MTLQLDTRYLPELSPEKHGILDHQSGDLFLSPETEKDWSAGEIQRYSGQFFNSYHDLLRGASGVVIQASWDDDMGIVGWDQKGKTFNVDTKTADTITLGFSAEKHVEEEELRCDDKGNKYYGTGIFGWHLTRTSGNGRTSVSFETLGTELGNVQAYSFDRQGKKTSIAVSDELIGETWSTIKRLTTDPIFQENVEYLREHRAKAVCNLGELSIAKHTIPYRKFRIEEERLRKIVDKQGFGRFWPDTVQKPIDQAVEAIEISPLVQMEHVELKKDDKEDLAKGIELSRSSALARRLGKPLRNLLRVWRGSA